MNKDIVETSWWQEEMTRYDAGRCQTLQSCLSCHHLLLILLGPLDFSLGFPSSWSGRLCLWLLISFSDRQGLVGGVKVGCGELFDIQYQPLHIVSQGSFIHNTSCW